MSNVTIDLTNPEEKARFEREERLKALKQQAETARLQAEAAAKEFEELEATGEERFQVEQAFKALKLADESNDAAKKDEAYQALYVTLQELYAAERRLKAKKEKEATVEVELKQQKEQKKQAEIEKLQHRKILKSFF